MAKPNKQIHFNAFFMASPSQSWGGLWAHPEANGLAYNELEFWTDLAMQAERGLLDCVFLADSLGLPDTYKGKPDALIRSATMFPSADPMMLISAMAAVTKGLCFGITSNTTYEPPYLLARRFSTLDHLTRGRLAWNVVTGVIPATARAMGMDPVPHDKRYDLADEYMDLVYKLWEESWEEDAVLRNKQQRIFADPAKIHAIHHHSEHFRCDGVHLVEPSPQRTPLIFTAGSSGRGQDFSGRHSECTFMSTNNLAHAKRTAAGFREAAVRAGRTAQSVKVFAAATVMVAPSEAEARDLVRDIQGYSDQEGNLAIFSAMAGIDLGQIGPDEPIEVINSQAIQSIAAAMKAGNGGRPVTPRDLARFADVGGREAFIVGSPSQVADTLTLWSEEADIDGFNLLRTVEPRGLGAFVDLVVPELQDRGVYKTEYASGTMRKKLFPEGGDRLPNEHYGAAFRHRDTGE
ncbi:LLM class flavin-dependent oxidoreductase [Novosphingobium kaempferiae]|uniref:LLM class flavin-dependent oxidoreductase n=1 Tax=Novosphingobium kaempferiae TaxID=2896849 RepID=UPI001E577BB6|nr:LLM class flavin-dependent oxidoreductase [Novosphingobium kaempferiae]